MTDPARDGQQNGAHDAERAVLEQSNRLFGTFMKRWVPMLAVLIVVEVLSLPADQRTSLVLLTAVTGSTAIVAALQLRNVSIVRVAVLLTVLLDVAAVVTGLLTPSGNDAAVFLPFLATLMVSPLFGGRRLVAVFLANWTVGVVASWCAFALSPLRNLPGLEPLATNVGAAAAFTAIGYGVLWWVRDRLFGAIAAAHAAEERAVAAEREARRGATALASLVAASPVATLSCTLDERVVTWNAAAGRLLGWQDGEVLGRVWRDFVAEDDHATVLASAQQALAAGIVPPVRTHWRRADGSFAVVELYLARQEAAGADDPHLVGQLVDVTEGEALAERVAEVARLEAVGQLAGGVAHDFNNLLTAIGGYAELIAADPALDVDRRRDAAEILRATDRGAAVVRQLLMFGRRATGSPAVIDLGDLVIGLAPLFERLIGAEVAISLLPPPAPVCVRADPSQVEQVVTNLAVNARDAMPNGGRLTIETREARVGPGSGIRERAPDLPDGTYGEVVVSDTGVGMDAATMARIFEPFFTTKAPGTGTGLGLATAFGSVRSAGGAIWAVSQPGRGTSFHVLLPLATGAAPAGAVAAPRPAPGDGETVLVVDDEAWVREVVHRMLAREGYRVLIADGPAAALAIAREHAGRIDLLLTDVVMPEMRGPVLAGEIARLGGPLRTLYMSGFTSDRAEIAAGRAASGSRSAFLPKPFALAELLRAVREALDAPEPGSATAVAGTRPTAPDAHIPGTPAVGVGTRSEPAAHVDATS